MFSVVDDIHLDGVSQGATTLKADRHVTDKCKAPLMVIVAAVLLGACGGGPNGSVDASAVSTNEPSGEPIEIRTRLTIAAEPGSEPIATGEVLEGSTLAGSPFCVGGSILDSHADRDPAMAVYLIDRNITCPDGTVRIGFTPNLEPGLSQTGSWSIVGGTGAFEGIGGSGDMAMENDPDDPSLAHETLTGTATR